MELSSNLLDEAIGERWKGAVVLVEDCVETSGAFVLHHFIKRFLSPQSSAFLIFVAYAHPFSHYDRILRKLGCNLNMQKDNNRLLFLDMLMPGRSDEVVTKSGKAGLRALYHKIHKAVEMTYLSESKKDTIIMIDDISAMEVAANGSSDDVLDFLHYCHTLTTQFGCLFVVLTHEDIYSVADRATLLLKIEYLADVLVKAEPLATGLATDVHGQLTVLNKSTCYGMWSSRNKTHNFQFRLKESSVEYFYPGNLI